MCSILFQMMGFMVSYIFEYSSQLQKRQWIENLAAFTFEWVYLIFSVCDYVDVVNLDGVRELSDGSVYACTALLWRSSMDRESVLLYEIIGPLLRSIRAAEVAACREGLEKRKSLVALLGFSTFSSRSRRRVREKRGKSIWYSMLFGR